MSVHRRMVVGEEDDLGDEVALAGDRLAVIAEVAAETVEERGASALARRGIGGEPPGLGRTGVGGCSSSMRLRGVLEQLRQRGERPAADLLHRRLELPRSLPLIASM